MKHRRLSITLTLALTVFWAFEKQGAAEDPESSKSQTEDRAVASAGAQPTSETSATGAISKPAQKPPVKAAPVADTVLSPLGGYGTSPPPETGPYDAPDLSPITKLNEQLPRWIEFGLEERL